MTTTTDSPPNEAASANKYLHTIKFGLVPVATGITLGVLCAICLDLAIGGVARPMMGANEDLDRLVGAVAQMTRAGLAAFGVFWIRAYADDIYNKPKQPSDRVTLKNDPVALILWTFFAAFSLLLGAKIVERGVAERFHSEREIHVLNFADSEKLPPTLTYSRVAWHFFFNPGTINRTSSLECDNEDGNSRSTPRVCPISEIATHANNPAGKDLCGRNIGTTFHDLSTTEADNRLVGIVQVIAQCAQLKGDTGLAAKMAILGAGASRAKWSGCTNSDQLDAALIEARLTRMRDLFAAAKVTADATAESDLKRFIAAVELGAPSKDGHSEKDVIDFSDRRFADLYNSGIPRDLNDDDTPFNITQSAYIMLKNPAGCSLLEPVGRK